ncbi:MAG: NfeD family protein [Bacteroides sp.]|nr:NfeD family protein [Bacteroides sp.]MCM1378609.1 NfeD family protein [Bacteroides sp.]MCM1444910.1 NfeD family protein [Prevotella sp.]
MAWLIWLCTALVLLLVEVFSQAVWSFCLAIGCLCASVLSVFVPSLAAQGITIGVCTLIAWLLLAPIVKKWEHKRSKTARTGMDALLGRKAVVTDEIRPGELGRARIDGDYWQVRAPGIDTTIHRGAEVSVTAYDSIILTVEKI